MAAIALFGSGEFLPWALDVDRWLAETASAPSERALIVPTASAPEGEKVFQGWADLGVAHYGALGLEPVVVELRDRADAERADIVDLVDGARLIFFSGGNPGYLCETLTGTAFWRAVVATVREGTALGGCSAGAVALGTLAPYVSDEGLDRWVNGFRLLTRAYVMPHFDALESYMIGLRKIVLDARPEGSVAVGIDEDTAIYGDGETWSIAGAGSVWVTTDASEPVPYPPGDTLALYLGLSLD